MNSELAGYAIKIFPKEAHIINYMHPFVLWMHERGWEWKERKEVALARPIVAFTVLFYRQKSVRFLDKQKCLDR